MEQVLHLRDPATGENGLFGEFLTNAQGERRCCRSSYSDAYFRDGTEIPGSIRTVQRSLPYTGNTLQRYAGYGVYSRAR